jgi:hypothetical protein
MKEEVGSWWKEPQKVKESCAAQENLYNAQDAPDDVQLAGTAGEKRMTLQQRLQEEEVVVVVEEWLA